MMVRIVDSDVALITALVCRGAHEASSDAMNRVPTHTADAPSDMACSKEKRKKKKKKDDVSIL